MSFLRNITSGFRSLFRKEQVDREMNEELGAYLEMEATEKMKQSPNMEERNRLGSMADSMEITGDVVSPVMEIQEIEALKH